MCVCVFSFYVTRVRQLGFHSDLTCTDVLPLCYNSVWNDISFTFYPLVANIVALIFSTNHIAQWNQYDATPVHFRWSIENCTVWQRIIFISDLLDLLVISRLSTRNYDSNSLRLQIFLNHIIFYLRSSTKHKDRRSNVISSSWLIAKHENEA